jgi:hypothetical protein
MIAEQNRADGTLSEDERASMPDGGTTSRPGSRPASNTAVAALVISLAGFLVSATNLYLTQISSPPLSVTFGPSMAMYYPRDGGFGMYLPVGFFNSGGRGGMILRTRAALHHEASSETYEFEWASFSTRDPVTRDYLLGEVGPLAVPANSAVSKMVWYVWRPDARPEFSLAAGRYLLSLQVWTADTPQPSFTVEKAFLLSEDEATDMAERRASGEAKTMYVTFEGLQPENSTAPARGDA